MKNWQDYATNADTGEQPKRNIKPVQTLSPKTKSKYKLNTTWYIINIVINILCIAALLFGIIKTINNPTPATFFAYVAAAFLGPGFIVSQLFLFITGHANTHPIGIIIISFATSAFLGLLLIINSIIAIIYYVKYKSSKNSARLLRNALFATIPPVFILTILILLLFNHF